MYGYRFAQRPANRESAGCSGSRCKPRWEGTRLTRSRTRSTCTRNARSQVGPFQLDAQTSSGLIFYCETVAHIAGAGAQTAEGIRTFYLCCASCLPLSKPPQGDSCDFFHLQDADARSLRGKGDPSRLSVATRRVQGRRKTFF